MKSRFVFDTNPLIITMLSPHSTNALALKRAEFLGEVLYSHATQFEFIDVLFRKKFDRFFTLEEREEIADRFLTRFTEKKVNLSINACRDPKDDKFLQLAVSAKASCLISGDIHLLELHPFRGIPILNAKDFLESF